MTKPMEQQSKEPQSETKVLAKAEVDVTVVFRIPVRLTYDYKLSELDETSRDVAIQLAKELVLPIVVPKHDDGATISPRFIESKVCKLTLVTGNEEP